MQISRYLLARQYVWWREVIHFIGEERRVQISRLALQHNILPSQFFELYSKNICQIFKFEKIYSKSKVKYSNFMTCSAPQNYTSHKIFRPQNTWSHIVFIILIVEFHPILDNDFISWFHKMRSEIFIFKKNSIWSSWKICILA